MILIRYVSENGMGDTLYTPKIAMSIGQNMRLFGQNSRCPTPFLHLFCGCQKVQRNKPMSWTEAQMSILKMKLQSFWDGFWHFFNLPNHCNISRLRYPDLGFPNAGSGQPFLWAKSGLFLDSGFPTATWNPTYAHDLPTLDDVSFPSQVDHRYLKHRGFTVPYSCDLQLLTQSCSQSIHFQVGPVALVDSHYTGCFEFPGFQNQVVEPQKLSAHWYSRLDITQLSIPQIFINWCSWDIMRP